MLCVPSAVYCLVQDMYGVRFYSAFLEAIISYKVYALLSRGLDWYSNLI